MTTDTAVLRAHLLGRHPGAHAPWFARSGYLGVMTLAQLEALHAELVGQGEDCGGRMTVAEARTMTGSAA